MKWSGNFDKAADPRSTGAKTGPQRPRRRSHPPIADSGQCINAVFARPLRRGSRFLLLPSSTPLRTCTPSTAGCSAKDPMVVAFATASHAAPAPRMSAPMETRPRACAPAARGRDHRAGGPRASGERGGAGVRGCEGGGRRRQYGAATRGVRGWGSNAGIVAQEFSTVKFDAPIDDMLIAEGINSGESLANLTIITVYSRTMVEGTNVSIIRPLGFGSWKLDNTADNFNLGTDPSIRKDNGNIGANSYSVPHPEDSTFFIRAARLHETSSVSEWFNVDGTLASTLTDTGAAYATGTDNFVIGDIRVDSSDTVTADLSIAEVIVYNRALEEEEIQGISEWLQTNIGVSASDEGGLAEVGLLGFWSLAEQSLFCAAVRANRG